MRLIANIAGAVVMMFAGFYICDGVLDAWPLQHVGEWIIFAFFLPLGAFHILAPPVLLTEEVEVFVKRRRELKQRI